MADHEHKDEHGEGHGKGHGGGGHGHGGGGHEEHEGAPEWLISFADNVMLQMGFFVILFVLSKGVKPNGNTDDVGDQAGHTPSRASELDFVIAVREGFNNPVDLGSDDPKDLPLIKRILERTRSEATRDGPEGLHQDLQSVRPSDYSDIGGLIRFERGSSMLGSAGREVADDVAQRIRGLNWIVEVRGHASPFETLPDRDPLRAVRLSHERALSVALALTQSGVKWSQLRVVACGDNDRLVARSYDSGSDAANQRVEIVVTKELIPPDPYGREAGAGGGGSLPGE